MSVKVVFFIASGGELCVLFVALAFPVPGDIPPGTKVVDSFIRPPNPMIPFDTL